MSQERLSSFFTGAAAKRLSEVEVNPAKSNQHEFQGTASMRAFLGDVSERRRIRARFVHLTDDSEPFVEDSEVTYYDARATQPQRSAEYRLYYPRNEVMKLARSGDLLLIAQRPDGTLVVVIATAESSIESQIRWLFELGGIDSHAFRLTEDAVFTSGLKPVDAEVLIAAFGIEPDITEDSVTTETIDRFGLGLPTTAIFSKFARSLVPDADPVNAPDQTLLKWWETEYQAFQALERHIVSARLESGFQGAKAVEDFLSFSLSVQNRRKSRSGHAFENHLAEIFNAHELAFSVQSRTERGAKPDFLFPGQAAYIDSSFPPEQLRMLGAKTTAKDRWRQVLPEADRIPLKHLATLEPAISQSQTDEMRDLGVQLVVPAPLHMTYSDIQQQWLWTVADFITEVQLIGARAI